MYIIENTAWIQWYVLQKGNLNGPLNYEKELEGKTMKYVLYIQCRFNEFLIQLCILKKNYFLGSVQKYYYYVQKNCLFGFRVEILLTRYQGYLDSRAGPFLGSVKKYWFFWRNMHLWINWSLRYVFSPSTTTNSPSSANFVPELNWKYTVPPDPVSYTHLTLPPNREV